MMHLLINSLAASAGGGLTYVRNVLPHLGQREDVKTTILLDERFARDLPPVSGVEVVASSVASSAALRFFQEQRLVPRVVRQAGAEVLLATGNFAIAASPVPQILLSRNSLYTSRDFDADLRHRGDYRIWLDAAAKAAAAKWSIGRADLTVAPSEAFAAELRSWTGRPVTALHHGFDAEEFRRDQTPLSEEVRQKLTAPQDALRLLFVSHYNYYRNFETLLRALPLIKRGLGGRPVRLFLTCTLEPGKARSGYKSDSDYALVRELGIADEVVELGAINYRQLHRVYRSADLYVTAAYAESFAHPLVEAMASGLPVVASDLPVHREICGGSGVYFSRFSLQELAERVLELAALPEAAGKMSALGLTRSVDFSWKLHVERVIEEAKRLIDQSRNRG